MNETPTLTKRRLQAQVIGPIYDEMARQIGEEKAAEILDAAVRKAAIAEGQYFAEKAVGQTSMRDFISLYDLWTADGALEIDVLEASDTKFDFNVTRCRYAEMYKEMGLGKIGHLLSCNRMVPSARATIRTSPCSATRPSWPEPHAAPSATLTRGPT